MKRILEKSSNGFVTETVASYKDDELMAYGFGPMYQSIAYNGDLFVVEIDKGNSVEILHFKNSKMLCCIPWASHGMQRKACTRNETPKIPEDVLVFANLSKE